MFQGTELVRKSIELVQSRANRLKENRQSLEDLQFAVKSRVHKNLEIQLSLSPEHKKKKPKQKKKSGKTWADLTRLSGSGSPPPKALTQKKNKPKLNKSVVQVQKPKPPPEKPQLCFGKILKEEEDNTNYNPFSITAMEMRRIKQSIQLTDEAHQKLFEREKMIEEYQNDLDYIQEKIERGKLDKQRGVKRARPYRQRYREAVNEDCLNISVNNPTMGQ